MFCHQCGKEYKEKVNFCCHCGAAMFVPATTRKKLMRSRRDRKIAGVCGGFAEHLELDPTLVRLVWLMLSLFAGWGLLAYLIAWIVMPEEPATQSVSVPLTEAARQPAANH